MLPIISIYSYCMLEWYIYSVIDNSAVNRLKMAFCRIF